MDAPRSGGTPDARSDAPLEAAPPRDAAEDAPEASRDGETGAETGAPAGTGALCGVNGRDDCGFFHVCDSILGCVDCASDAECPRSAPRCVEGACVACAAPEGDAGSGCAPGMACYPADHACRPACTGPGSCPASAPTCELATGACVECTTHADCPGSACEPTTRRCVACLGDADCPAAAPRCNLATHACVQCSSNADCGLAAPICDPTTRACRVGCTRDAECAPGRCDLMTASCTSSNDGGADG